MLSIIGRVLGLKMGDRRSQKGCFNWMILGVHLKQPSYYNGMSINTIKSFNNHTDFVCVVWIQHMFTLKRSISISVSESFTYGFPMVFPWFSHFSHMMTLKKSGVFSVPGVAAERRWTGGYLQMGTPWPGWVVISIHPSISIYFYLFLFISIYTYIYLYLLISVYIYI